MAMKLALIIIATGLVGCSQDVPAVLARAERGNLMFDVQAPERGRDCITRIAVFVEDNGYLAMPETGDDRDRVEAGDYWRAVSDAKVQCIGGLPLRYGSAVGGSTVVKPKPLRVGPTYTVALAEGRSEHRMGRFRLLPDKRVENLPL